MRNPRRIFYAADTLSCFVSSYPFSARKSPRTKLQHAIRREMLTWQFPPVIARPGGPHAMFSPLRNHVAMCLNTDHRLPPKSPVPSITFRLLVLKGYDKKILLSWFSSVKNNHHHFLDLFHSPSNLFFFLPSYRSHFPNRTTPLFFTTKLFQPRACPRASREPGYPSTEWAAACGPGGGDTALE